MTTQPDPLKHISNDADGFAKHDSSTSTKQSPHLDNLDRFLMECHAVCSGRVEAITGLRARSRATGLSLARMHLAAAAASIEIIADGRELKAVRMAVFDEIRRREEARRNA